MPQNAPPPEEDDDFEYEVEPLDEDVVAHQERHAREELARAQRAIDVDSIYREMERRDDFDAAFESLRARISVRSMLIATTVVAVVLAIGGSGLLNGATFAAFICLSLLGLGSAHAWLNFQESRRRAELVARREAELRRARRPADEDHDEDEDESARENPSLDLIDTVRAMLRFSLAELLIATAAAGVMVGFMTFAGSPTKAAGGLGAMAITGFALQAAEVTIPRPAVLAWWMALLGYGVTLLIGALI